MDITELIKHPEQLDRDTLYELRSILALYPYFQTARLLMLQNLYILHDPSFDEELRRAAAYITDRRVIFQLVEAAHYQLPKPQKQAPEQEEKTAEEKNRTISLIDNFLDSIPKEPEKEEKKKRRPTPADAAVDYVAYLLESEEGEIQTEEEVPQLKGQSLIDSFIENDKGKIVLNETPQFTPQMEKTGANEEKEGDESYFTETLARIYIKQGRYSKALEIIKRLNLNYPKKNAYFADQIRFLEKLIMINGGKDSVR